MTRHIELEGIENFRDFGGYDTACGRGLKRGLLYRSANHSYATDQDLAALKALGVKVIVDLRRPREREREPSRRPPGFDGVVVENDLDGTYLDWADAMAGAERIDADWFRRDSTEYYRRAPYEPRHIDLYRRYFQALAEIDGVLVVHCAAGKDRTGMICAFTHHIAGVRHGDTLADYLATNNEATIARRAGFLGPWITDLTGHVVDDAALRVAISVHPEYLETAYTRIADEHGSLDRYLEEVLGVDSALRAKIEARILG